MAFLFSDVMLGFVATGAERLNVKVTLGGIPMKMVILLRGLPATAGKRFGWSEPTGLDSVVYGIARALLHNGGSGELGVKPFNQSCCASSLEVRGRPLTIGLLDLRPLAVRFSEFPDLDPPFRALAIARRSTPSHRAPIGGGGMSFHGRLETRLTSRCKAVASRGLLVEVRERLQHTALCAILVRAELGVTG